MAMEKTQRKQSLNSLSNTPKLFDLNELLSSLKITPGQMENMKGLIYIEGLTYVLGVPFGQAFRFYMVNASILNA